MKVGKQRNVPISDVCNSERRDDSFIISHIVNSSCSYLVPPPCCVVRDKIWRRHGLINRSVHQPQLHGHPRGTADCTPESTAHVLHVCSRTLRLLRRHHLGASYFHARARRARLRPITSTAPVTHLHALRFLPAISTCLLRGRSGLLPVATARHPHQGSAFIAVILRIYICQYIAATTPRGERLATRRSATSRRRMLVSARLETSSIWFFEFSTFTMGFCLGISNSACVSMHRRGVDYVQSARAAGREPPPLLRPLCVVRRP